MPGQRTPDVIEWRVIVIDEGQRHEGQLLTTESQAIATARAAKKLVPTANVTLEERTNGKGWSRAYQ